jgi:hypothetical protein
VGSSTGKWEVRHDGGDQIDVDVPCRDATLFFAWTPEEGWTLWGAGWSVEQSTYDGPRIKVPKGSMRDELQRRTKRQRAQILEDL